MGSTSPERIRISVVLPAPLGPSSACTSPGATSRSMPLSASHGPEAAMQALDLDGRTGARAARRRSSWSDCKAGVIARSLSRRSRPGRSELRGPGLKSSSCALVQMIPRSRVDLPTLRAALWALRALRSARRDLARHGLDGAHVAPPPRAAGAAPAAACSPSCAARPSTLPRARARAPALGGAHGAAADVVIGVQGPATTSRRTPGSRRMPDGRPAPTTRSSACPPRPMSMPRRSRRSRSARGLVAAAAAARARAAGARARHDPARRLRGARSCPRCGGRRAWSASPAAATPRPCSPPRRPSRAARACRCRCRSPTASRARPAPQETEWQEQVDRPPRARGLGPDRAAGDLDCVGPVATAVLRRHGLLWPCNAYFHEPIFEAAAGGAVLTGVGGDEALLALELGARARRPARPRAARARATCCASASRSPPRPSSARRSAAGCPSSARGCGPRRARRIEDFVAAEAASEPLRWRTPLPRAGRLGLHGGQPRQPRRAGRRPRRRARATPSTTPASWPRSRLCRRAHAPPRVRRR